MQSDPLKLDSVDDFAITDTYAKWFFIPITVEAF